MSKGIVVVLMVAALLAGCGGQDEVPEGFERFDSETFSVLHPQDWEVGQRADQGESLTIFGETGPAGVRQAAIVKISPIFSGNFDVAMDGLNDLANIEFEDRELLQNVDVEVEGARQARLLESTYRGEGIDSDELVDMHQFDLFMVSQDEIVYYLRVNAPVELFEDETFRTIVDSFELKG